MTAYPPWRMETPSLGGLAHLESNQGSPGGPVRFLRVFSLLAVLFPYRGPLLARIGWHTAGPGVYASTPFPPVADLVEKSVTVAGRELSPSLWTWHVSVFAIV